MFFTWSGGEEEPNNVIRNKTGTFFFNGPRSLENTVKKHMEIGNGRGHYLCDAEHWSTDLQLAKTSFFVPTNN